MNSVHSPPVWPEFNDPDLGAGDATHRLPAIPCGLYHVDEPGGSTVPVRVRRRADYSRFAPGKWVMEWLLGHDGRTWEAFAFVTSTSLDIYKRFKKTDYAEVGERLFKHMSDGECFDGWDFKLVEARCARCGRMLSDQDRESGIGKACAKEWGL